MTQISQHFSLREFTRSDTADRIGARNDHLSPTERKNIERLAHLLEQIRAEVGAPIHITSGFRSDAVNRAVGGAPRSAHRLGYAADIRTDALSPVQLYDLIRKRMGQGILRLDQLILYDTHVHVSADPRYRGEAFRS